VVTISINYNKIQKLCLVVPEKKLCLILFSGGGGRDYFSKLHEPAGIRKENTVMFFLLRMVFKFMKIRLQGDPFLCQCHVFFNGDITTSTGVLDKRQ